MLARTLLRDAAMLIGCALLFSGCRSRRPPARVYKVGFQNSPPRQYVAPDGKPYGPVIDILREASQRAGVQLEWVLVPEGPDRALGSGQVDLWPLVARMPDREGRFHITAPYSQVTYWLISKADETRDGAFSPAGKTIAYTSGVTQRMATQSFPSSTLVQKSSRMELVRAVCAGDVDAGVLPDSNADASLLNGVSGCAGTLSFIAIPGGQLWSGVGAPLRRPGAVAAADAIRAAIGDMAADGRLAAIYFRWYASPSNEALLLQYLAQAQREDRIKTIGLVLSIAGCGLLAWLVANLRRAKKEAESASAARSEFL